MQDLEGLPPKRVKGNSDKLFVMCRIEGVDKNLHRADEFLQKVKRCKL